MSPLTEQRVSIAVAAAARTAPILHVFIPIGRLGGYSNRRHKHQLRNVLWMLQRVHRCKVAAHAKAAKSRIRIGEQRAE
jgi:hypothetical protein